MTLNSSVNLPPNWKGIGRTSPLLFIGSCFSENIGNALKDAKFPAVVNPFGITYNPLSAMDQLVNIAEGGTYSHSQLQRSGELWCSLDHHGRFSSTQPDACLNAINKELTSARNLNNPIVLLTFGTGWVWEKIDDSRVVNNCHKLPSSAFTRRLPHLDELLKAWESVRSLWKNSTFIISVSPVRYDDAVANSRGKALLHMFCHELETREEARYFPSYELLHHQLRDYRFYARDRRHPSEEAIDIIRDAFLQWALNDEAATWYQAYTKLHRNRQHRPLHPDTEEARLFSQRIEEQINTLKKNYPDVDI